jgi:hypothetical protein
LARLDSVFGRAEFSNASLIAGAAGLIAEKPFALYAIGRDRAPAARHLLRLGPHVVDRQEPGQDQAMRMASANLL